MQVGAALEPSTGHTGLGMRPHTWKGGTRMGVTGSHTLSKSQDTCLSLAVKWHKAMT